VIGFLSAEWPGLTAERMRAFQQGLSETGYVEGRNVGIEYRYAGPALSRLHPAALPDRF
jgi:putative ABC transport system substrate-binding protein